MLIGSQKVWHKAGIASGASQYSEASLIALSVKSLYIGS